MCTRSHPRTARGAFTRCRFVYAERGRPGAKVCKLSPPGGLDKARLRHRSGRPAMDTTESAERAHSPARSPSRSRRSPPAQPRYLAALSIPAYSPPSPRARCPRSPGTARPRLILRLPPPQPSPYARRPCPRPCPCPLPFLGRSCFPWPSSRSLCAACTCHPADPRASGDLGFELLARERSGRSPMQQRRCQVAQE